MAISAQKQKEKNSRGEILIYLLIIISLFSAMMWPVIANVTLESQAGTAAQNRELALQIAEAGVDYYQWHLAHFPTDYKDGTSGSCSATCGPYVHSYVDSDTELAIGQYSLVITPPATGSTIVTIQSAGSTTANPSVTRTITARYGVPSLALYSTLTNSILWVGSGATVNGEVLSNNGIRFDGSTNSPVMSAKSTYSCSALQGSPCPHTENGVWGSGSSSFWQFPVGAVDFSGLTASLSALKSTAQSSGIYLPPSSADGYSIVFNASGTVDIYKVNTLVSEPSWEDVNGTTYSNNIDYSSRTELSGYPAAVPANGVIFAEDNVWVEGTVKGRVIVAAGETPDPCPCTTTLSPNNIYVPNNITYLAKDGSDVLGLVAQNNVMATYDAPSNLEIDGAIVAQDGSTEFPYFSSGGLKNTLTFFGSMMSYGEPGWAWGSPVVSGFQTRNYTYDANLIFGPPPSFPLSTSGYQQMSWTSN